MGKGSKNCKVTSHQILKDQAKNRVEDLQLMLNQLQFARKESRARDVATLEEQVNQVLREWKAELDEPTPSSSLLEGSLGLSEELGSLLRQFDVEDDATSPLAEPPTMRHGQGPEHGHGHVNRALAVTDSLGDKEVYYLNNTPQQYEFQGFENHVANHVQQQHEFQGFENSLPPQHEFQGFENHIHQQHEFQGLEHCSGAPTMQGTMVNNFEASGLHNLAATNGNMTSQLDYLNAQQNLDNEIFISANGIQHWGLDDISDFSSMSPNFNPPPSAFLGPICALWDCARPAQGSEFCNNYCSSFHAELAVKECPPGTSPVLRPGGIGLKDGPLVVTLRSKVEGKDVGIPECPGAATAKSPWNAPELFDISILEGEKIREWLFFDKPRRAFETGNRKQRSLPDHVGRGWHESRKQILSEYGGRKRSYYADPQPQKNFEWHLYEYEIDNCDVYALYRLELKVADEKKKSPKTKVTSDPLVDLQKRMGRLTAEVSVEGKLSRKGKLMGDVKSNSGHVILASSSSSETDVQGPPEKHLGDSENC